MIEVEELEGIALEAWEATGEMLPVEAVELAERLGLECIPWMKSTGRRVGSRLWHPASSLHTRPVRQQGIVRHELAHWLLEDHGHDARDEDAARYLSGALGLPRRPFLADFGRTVLDLDALELLHPHVSAEAIVCRMTQVMPATAWVWDAGKLSRTYGVAEDAASVAELVEQVLTLERPVVEGCVRAWPRIDGAWRRVLVVARAA